LMISHIKNLPSSTIIIFIVVLTILSIAILTPILSMILFGAILAYYVRYVCRKIRPKVKYNTLAVLLGMIMLPVPIFLLLYFTLSQFISIAGLLFGALQQAATASNFDTPQLSQAIHNLGFSNDIT